MKFRYSNKMIKLGRQSYIVKSHLYSVGPEKAKSELFHEI
jgi:hypothetical protein